MEKRIVALDVGDRRIGIAVSDPLGITAQPIETYTRVGYGPDVKHIAAICAQAGMALMGPNCMGYVNYAGGMALTFEPAHPQPALIRWDRDAPEILEGVNAAAGFDVRERESLHWWTFVSLFHSIGEGRLAQLVTIRSKKLRGEKLTEQEQDYVRRYPEKFRPQESPEEKQQRQRLEALLMGS